MNDLVNDLYEQVAQLQKEIKELKKRFEELKNKVWRMPEARELNIGNGLEKVTCH